MSIALYVSELLDGVLACLRRGDCLRMALVCKAFREQGLNHVWFDVENLRDLLGLLAPIVVKKGGYLVRYIFSLTKGV